MRRSILRSAGTRWLAAAVVAGTTLGGTTAAAHAEPKPQRELPSSGCEADLPPERKPIPGNPLDLLPRLPDRLSIPLPYPRILPVPEPAPEKPVVRIPSEPPPKDPCSDPCPDITDPPKPKPGAGGPALSLEFPKITLDPAPKNIPVPVPNPNPPPLPPRPAKVNPGVDAGPVAPKPTPPRVSGLEWVGTVTGQGSTSRTDKRWQINGTDLGIMWEAEPDKVAIVFGDTFGKGFRPPGANGRDWRSNVLGFSSDKDLSDGLFIDTMIQDSRCHAAELLSARRIDHYEITVIPTSGFAVGDRQYMSYMSVRTWGEIPGLWLTNYGGLAYSDDGGSTWVKDPYARWDNIFGVSQFQVSSMVPKGDHVYMFGTPNGRIGSVGVARVHRDHILNKTAYQYWRDGKWVPARDGNAASVIIGGPAGEINVRYDESTDRWQMTYLDAFRGAIVLRKAREPQGLWSEPSELVHSSKYAQLYGGFMHPWSAGEDLYFTLSTWTDYNVSLMRARVR
ncbi:hypothetical protein GP2_011_00470 [Gordonia paraffinivorans NBRC 108238]|uniref:DUF4185 domain-containing protein n=1 Tax=Gordonia paraffinivorans NBRC 108238 TaxID=1223543 RepID=A0ABQ0IIA3_9ACTN|nr:DUF4185 domain-containing protein [Gordonia paraffinivorans]GAC83321.1 hypothetical protein GP2_011_00470 [Gordonia paraffinivorans NBRC 108238]